MHWHAFKSNRNARNTSLLIFYAACAFYGAMLGSIDLPSVAKAETMLPQFFVSLARWPQRYSNEFGNLTIFYALLNLYLMALLLFGGKRVALLMLCVTFAAALSGTIIQTSISMAMRAAESGGVYEKPPVSEILHGTFESFLTWVFFAVITAAILAWFNTLRRFLSEAPRRTI